MGLLQSDRSIPEIVDKMDDDGQPGYQASRVIANKKIQHPKRSKGNQQGTKHGTHLPLHLSELVSTQQVYDNQNSIVDQCKENNKI